MLITHADATLFSFNSSHLALTWLSILYLTIAMIMMYRILSVCVGYEPEPINMTFGG